MRESGNDKAEEKRRRKTELQKERIKNLRSSYLTQDLDDLERRFMELMKELGFSYDDNLVLNRDVAPNSVLGRLQAQIDALIEANGFEETYSGGKLIFKKLR